MSRTKALQLNNIKLREANDFALSIVSIIFIFALFIIFKQAVS